jgi:hypothetical protein
MGATLALLAVVWRRIASGYEQPLVVPQLGQA